MQQGTPGKEVDDTREVGESEVLTDVVYQLGQHGEGQRAQLGLALPPPAHQRLLLQQCLQLPQEPCRNDSVYAIIGICHGLPF